MDLVTCEGSYCGATGWLVGRHTGPWLGQGASQANVRIRSTPFITIVEIVDTILIIM